MSGEGIRARVRAPEIVWSAGLVTENDGPYEVLEVLFCDPLHLEPEAPPK